MAKPIASKWPKLKAYWDAYGHSVKWDQLFDMKVRRDGGYAVLAWELLDGSVGLADLARTGDGWEMINDGFEAITRAEWKKLSIDPYCDSFTIPGKVWN